MSKRSLLLVLSFLIVSSAFSQGFKDTLQSKLLSLQRQNNLPGFAIAIVNMDSVLFQAAYGYADLENKQAYTIETIQSVASVTKTTIAFAVMKLHEAGKLDLDSPINDFLPYEVFNPHCKDDVIRVRHLVTHTSGIVDTDNNYDLRGRYFTKLTDIKNSKLDTDYIDFIKLLKKNKKLSLKKYCKYVFSEKGKWYQEDTFLKEAPGTHYQYSNLGAVLMAHIVEKVRGRCFNKYIEAHLFRELNMELSGFSINKANKDLLATSYVMKDFVATPIFGDNTYPDGGLLTNCKELSLYLIEMIKGYNNQSKLLKGQSYQLMMHPMLSNEVTRSKRTGKNFKNIGVFWQIAKDGSIMHNGGNPLGGAVYLSFNPTTNIGRILMTNCDIRASRSTALTFLSIWRAMGKYAESL